MLRGVYRTAMVWGVYWITVV